MNIFPPLWADWVLTFVSPESFTSISLEVSPVPVSKAMCPPRCFFDIPLFTFTLPENEFPEPDETKTLDPALFKAITVGAALTSYVKSFMQKYQTQLYILIAIAVGIGISAYLSYESYATLLPNLSSKLDLVIQQCSTSGLSSVPDGTVVTR